MMPHKNWTIILGCVRDKNQVEYNTSKKEFAR